MSFLWFSPFAINVSKTIYKNLRTCFSFLFKKKIDCFMLLRTVPPRNFSWVKEKNIITYIMYKVKVWGILCYCDVLYTSTAHTHPYRYESNFSSQPLNSLALIYFDRCVAVRESILANIPRHHASIKHIPIVICSCNKSYI